MLNNYQYFMALAEASNISKAAQKLFISHQCLSKYLKNLEEEYHVAFFERTPKLALIHAGQLYLDTIRQVQLLEEDMNSRLEDIRQSKRGLIRLGTTEGRYRILIPDLMAQFKKLYPDVILDVQHSSNSRQLSEQVLENKLDIVLLNKSDINHNQLESKPVLEEQMYLVVSDNLLEEYFSDWYPQCKQEFAQGVDLVHLQKLPFVLGKQGFNSRDALEKHFLPRKLNLNCVTEMTQLDLHFMMTARDYAASFCWSMYIPSIQQLNESGNFSHLNVFPLRGRKIKNKVVLVMRKGKILPAYGRDLIQLIKQNCAIFADPDLEHI